jgi:hypothetical protein
MDKTLFICTVEMKTRETQSLAAATVPYAYLLHCEGGRGRKDEGGKSAFSFFFFLLVHFIRKVPKLIHVGSVQTPRSNAKKDIRKVARGWSRLDANAFRVRTHWRCQGDVGDKAAKEEEI